MTTENSTITAITSTGIAVTAVVFFQTAVLKMIPWLIASFPLILLDLDFGIKAAKFRKERVTFSKAFRKTFGKVVEYFAWVCFAATATLAFDKTWVEWVVLGLVYLNELTSIVGNYYETKGLQISWRYFFNWVAKIFGQKAGVDTDGLDTGELIKPKPKPRDAKGRFTKKK